MPPSTDRLQMRNSSGCGARGRRASDLAPLPGDMREAAGQAARQVQGLKDIVSTHFRYTK